MPKKVDGKWVFDDADEADLALATESRVRAARILRADDRKERQDAACAEGKHPGFKDKKCTHCKADEPAPTPEPPRRDARRSLL